MPPKRLSISAGIAVLVCALAVPASASAARYAAPGASDLATCAEESPCSINTAVNSAGIGEEVIVASGDYTIVAPLMVTAAGVNIHGVAGQPRPVIHGAPGAPLIDLVAAATTLNRLSFRRDGGDGPPAVQATFAAATLSDLEIVNTLTEGMAARLGGGVTLSGSTVRGTTTAIQVTGSGGGATLTNVTAWATGLGGSAIEADGIGLTVTATNTIARAPDGVSLSTVEAADFTLTNSNFSGTSGPVSVLGGANQSAAPLLANPSGGDFHQLPGSPTINAGIVNPLAGLTDFDGDARVVGLAPDIGADEYVPAPPGVATGDPVSVTTSGGRLTGTVDPNGRPTTYRFEFGPTPLYGSSTPVQDAGAGDGDVAVGADIGDLAPGSVIHYRLVASNADGEVAGLDRILIALPAPNLPLPDPPAPNLPTPPNGPTISNLTIPLTVEVGQPFVVRAGGRDPDDPVNSIAIDFDDGPGYFAESACRLRPPDPVFRDNRATNFSIPYSFSTPGTHTVAVTLGSGDCGRPGTTTTQTVQVEVTPATTRRRGIVAAAGCRDADLLPDAKNLKRIEKATVCLLNQERRKNRFKSFRVNKRLRKAAAMHNGYMMRGKFLAHQGPGEPPLAARFRKAKYRGGGGENIGVGAGVPYATPRGLVAGWMNSPVHRANILERAFFTVGVHVVAQKPMDPTLPGATYTAEFGTTRK